MYKNLICLVIALSFESKAQESGGAGCAEIQETSMNESEWRIVYKNLKNRVNNYSFDEYKSFIHMLLEEKDYEKALSILERNIKNGELDQAALVEMFPDNAQEIKNLFSKAFLFSRLQIDTCRLLCEELSRARALIENVQNKNRMKIVFHSKEMKIS